MGNCLHTPFFGTNNRSNGLAHTGFFVRSWTRWFHNIQIIVHFRWLLKGQTVQESHLRTGLHGVAHPGGAPAQDKLIITAIRQCLGGAVASGERSTFLLAFRPQLSLESGLHGALPVGTSLWSHVRVVIVPPPDPGSPSLRPSNAETPTQTLDPRTSSASGLVFWAPELRSGQTQTIRFPY